jgi:hypothetical protein
MDTSVLPNDTDDLHPSFLRQPKSKTKRDARAEASAGFGATTEGMAITKTYLAQVTKAVTDKLTGPRPSPTHSSSSSNVAP